MMPGHMGRAVSDRAQGRGARSRPRPNTPDRSDLDLICTLRTILPARVPASTASAGSREKVSPIRMKVLAFIARCCGLDTI